MELKGKRVLVVGLGESGLAMAKWLYRQGAFVRVADSRANPPNRDALASVAPDAEVIVGPFAAATFAGVDIVALSPGVPKATPEIAAVDLPLISEIELFVAGVRAQVPGSKIIAITGSNGKTTTTALTAHLLNGAGVPAIACGNISPSALDALMDAQDAERSGKPLPAVWAGPKGPAEGRRGRAGRGEGFGRKALATPALAHALDRFHDLGCCTLWNLPPLWVASQRVAAAAQSVVDPAVSTDVFIELLNKRKVPVEEQR